jgi:hypothetical protein
MSQSAQQFFKPTSICRDLQSIRNKKLTLENILVDIFKGFVSPTIEE